MCHYHDQDEGGDSGNFYGDCQQDFYRKLNDDLADKDHFVDVIMRISQQLESGHLERTSAHATESLLIDLKKLQERDLITIFTKTPMKSRFDLLSILLDNDLLSRDQLQEVMNNEVIAWTIYGSRYCAGDMDLFTDKLNSLKSMSKMLHKH